MRIVATLLFFSSLLFSFQIGDKISQNVQDKLNIKEDKVYIIDFFASWCPSCEKEMPYISKVNETINKDNIEIIGVGVDEDIKNGEAFVKKLTDANKLNFKIIYDPKNELIKEFDPIGMPALYFIKNAKVIDQIIGAKDDIDKIILNKLKDL